MMSSEQESETKRPDHCPSCGADISSSDKKCPGCDVDLEWIISQMGQRFVDRSGNRVPYVSVLSEEGEEVRHEMDPGKTVVCPECGTEATLKDKECIECGADLKEIIHQTLLEELLENVDDRTFEITDTESVVEEIKQFAFLMEESEEEYDFELKFMCPLCGSEVSESADECPGCGAIFED